MVFGLILASQSARNAVSTSPTLTPSGSGAVPTAVGGDWSGGSAVPFAINRCHALTASFSFSRPLTFKLTFFPSSVVYHVPLLSLNHGRLGRAIAVALAMPPVNGAPE